MNGARVLQTLDELRWPHLARATAGAFLLGSYASWIAADVLPRVLAFIVAAVAIGYLLFTTHGRRRQAAVGCYVLAGLLVLTPVCVVLPDVLSASVYEVSAASMVFTIANLLLFVPFAVAATIVTYVAYRLDGGTGILQRVQHWRDASSRQTTRSVPDDPRLEQD